MSCKGDCSGPQRSFCRMLYLESIRPLSPHEKAARKRSAGYLLKRQQREVSA